MMEGIDIEEEVDHGHELDDEERKLWDCVVHEEWQIKIIELKNYNLTFLLMILFILVGCIVFQSTPIRVEHISKNMRFLGGMVDI